ncbi:DUF3054 domain-containing protein [Nocardia higoensis]|uniref:DUF3054 domain-containing protein n=1 Tax=Nocardia higoensis TaxID=228599 RepID=A0ABS0DFE3_9NOCA|nr:DUF3054 domain-containing protein [Nocardia higoensis]MBF6356583.1 DUF3054 domain-containing protein [Nocardia higoensis]
MRTVLTAISVDLILVAVFCAIGRRSHDEAVLTGLLETLWPFAIGLTLGWALAVAASRLTGRAAFAPTAVWPTAVAVWLGTLAGGMIVRVIAGQGTAFSFIIVAGTVLAVFLIGWRAILAFATRSSRG